MNTCDAMKVDISGSLIYNPTTTNIIINISNTTTFLTRESNPGLYDVLFNLLKRGNEKPTP